MRKEGLMENAKLIRMAKPARRWDDGLPLGNGRLGAMVMGRVNDETIFINEETLWYGPRRERSNPNGRENLEKIRELLMKKQVEQASFLAKMSLTSLPKYNNPYQPAGDLRICFQGHSKPVQNYKRDLDLSSAVGVVEYDMDGVHYKREHFVSSRYQVLVVRITCVSLSGTKKCKMTLCANMSRKPFEENTGKIDKKTVGNWGQNGVGGVKYLTALRMLSNGTNALTGDFAHASKASEAVILLASRTDFAEKSELGQAVTDTLNLAEKVGYDELLKAHLSDYRAMYERLDFSIMQQGEVWNNELSTQQLIESVRNDEQTHVNQLTMLLLYYARYLMISCSSNCLMPANQQGMWNGSYEPPWQCQFTININVQMNYWFVEKANLAECHNPLFSLLERMVPNGQKTARELYGAGGFCAHHNTNLWASTDPEGIFSASPFWVMGGAWLALHMYEHYLYTLDKEFLHEHALPVMREALLFFKDYLHKAPDGSLLTGPCVSPENTYLTPSGEQGSLTMGPAMDCMILRQLLQSYLSAASDTDFSDTQEIECFENMLMGVPKTQIGKDGRILEWCEPFEECEPGHRHISHLYALHPGHEITKENKELFDAAKKTLEYRVGHGGGHTGWSRAWLACFYARLCEGDKVLSSVRELLKSSVQDNLLDSHPPFQIDGNFGIAEAIMESLAQSHGGYIELLPALPSAWENGKLQGFCLRGGITANMQWENKKVTRLLVKAAKETCVTFKFGDKLVEAHLAQDVWQEINFDI